MFRWSDWNRIQCGNCGNIIAVAKDAAVPMARCDCGSYVAKTGTPPDVMRAFVEQEERRRGTFRPPEWHPPTVRSNSDLARQDARARFDEGIGASRDEFYAGWAAYDAALQTFSSAQQDLQRKAEILDLERQLAL